MKVALWLDAAPGSRNVEVQVLGAIRLLDFEPAHDSIPSMLHGYFVSMFDPGPLSSVGLGFSPLQKPILVR